MERQLVGKNELAYLDNKMNGETILLIHGFCGSSDYWSKIIPRLSNHRVIAIDIRGHGGSSVTEDAFSVEDLAQDIEYFCDQKQLDQFFLFGHSLGGYITLAFADKMKQRLKGFGLIHSTSMPDDFQAKENRLKGIDSIQEKGMHYFVDELIPKLFAPDSDKELIEEALQIGYGTNPAAAKQCLKSMKNRPDRTDVMKNAEMPILLVAGKEDRIIPEEKAFNVEAPHISKKMLNHSGHMGMMEQPNELAEIINDFISNVQSN
ncbi:alpha/beta fold hydrolase [Falsibacillus albus]|uniref:Alpha/beta hydrolase n=1 Tax=Falsibacillus albus TaxID=2478915 RepID=A0A3L7K355_9BACI|nr:alpha/beta hydrolase [Falsibacillus albus]RLQ95142.1 alpha/beta hydrolase [Falsibacillus albus]